MVSKIFDIFRQYFRKRRYQQIKSLVNIDSVNGFILDLGSGPMSFFAAKFPRSKQVILLEINHNEAYSAKRKQPDLFVVIADGKKMPFRDNSIEMTISNSVIEHVNNPDKLAAEIKRTSRNYFIQTPSADFPLETHSFIPIPFYNFFDREKLQRFLCNMFGANFEYVRSVRYLSEQQLKKFFPDAFFTYERFFGLKKSFYIYHSNKELK